MARPIRKIIWIVSALIGLVALLPLVAALFLNSEQAKSVIISWVESRAGREFSIDGRLGMAMGLSTTIVAHDVRLSNSSWALADDMLAVDKVSVTLSVPGLLAGEGLIREIHVHKPILNIERHPQSGKFNVDLRRNTNSGNPSEPGFIASQFLGLGQVSIGDGQVVYYHPRRRWEFDIAQAVARSPAMDQPVELEISGAIEQTPVVLDGEIGNLRSIIERVQTGVSLQGHIVKPENTLLISGAIDNLRGWKGLDLWFETFITDLAGLSGLIGMPLPLWRDISASWNLLQPASPRTLRMDSIKMSSADYGLESSLGGQIGYLPRLRQLALTFSARGNLDHGIFSDKLNRNVELRTDINGTLARDDGDLRLTVNRGAIRSTGMKLDVTGVIERVTGDWSSPLQASLELDDLTHLGELINRQLPSVANISASGNIFRLDDEIRIFDILLQNDSPGVRALAAGRLENPGARQRGMIDFSVRAEADFIEQLTGFPKAGLLRYLTVSGTARLDAAEVSITDMAVDAQGPGIRMDGEGEFGSVGNLETLRVDLRASIQGLDKLHAWTGQPLPATEAITVRAELRGDEWQKLNLGNIRMQLTDPAVSATLFGEIRNLGKSAKLILNFDAEMQDTGPFLERYPDLLTDRFGPLVAELFPARALGQLRSTEIQNGGVVHSIEKFDIFSDAGLKSRISGRVDHLFTSRWSAPVSVRVYGELARGILPPIHAALVELAGYLAGTAEVSLSAQGVAVDRVQARLISGYSETRVLGKIESLSPFVTSGLKFVIDRPRLDDLLVAGIWPSLVRDLPIYGELVFSNAGHPGRVSLDLKMADSDLVGDIYLPPANGKKTQSEDAETLVSGKFSSQNMDLVKLLPAREQETPGFFPRNPVRLPWLEDAEVKIQADFGRLTSRILRLDEVALEMEVRDGLLSARTTGKSAGEGSMDIELSLSARPRGGLQSRIRLDGSDIGLSALAGTEQLDYEQKGVFSIQADIDGSGRSVAEIMGSASGLIRIRLNHATLKNQGLQLLGGDLFMGLLDVLNPFTTRDEIIHMDCGVINFDLDNGVASKDRGIALQTTDFTLLGGGAIDFSTESLDLQVSTKARKGLGVNIGSFSRVLLVKGKLGNPEVSPGKLLESGVALGVGYLTGGLSLFARGLFDLIEANSDVCATAMQG